MGSDQNLEKVVVLPGAGEGFCLCCEAAHAVERVGGIASVLFFSFSGWGGGEGFCQVSCHVSEMSEMSLPSLLSKSTSTATVGSYETLIHSSISSLFTLSSKSIK